MLMDPKKMSELIRNKKKKMLENPEVVNEDKPEMDAQDVHDTTQLGRIEATLDVPEKSNADITNLEMSDRESENVGLSEEEKKRMGRLREYIHTLDI